MVKIARYIYLIAVWLFVAGVVTQVFLAGMTVVARQMGWNNHIGLGHLLGAPLLISLVTIYLGRMPAAVKRLNWLLVGVYFIQADVIIFLRTTAPILSAFHPVLALADFALGLALARAALPLARDVKASAAAVERLEQSSPLS